MKIEQIQKIFAELEELTIDLPQDAAGLGADFLRESVSLCRGYLNQVGLHYQRILSEKTIITMKLESKESEFQIKSDELLTQDPRVKVLSALADRQAMVNNILLNERRELETLRLELKSCDQVEKVVRFRHKELEQTMSALRIQRSLLKDQLHTGSFYGDESPTARDDDGVSNMDGDELDKILEEAEKEVASDDETLGLVTDIEGEDDGEVVLPVDEPEPTPEPEAEPEKPVSKGVAAPKKKKAKKKTKKGPAPEADDDGNVSIGDDLDDFVESGGFQGEADDLQDEIDSLVDEGGTDDTPDPEPLTPDKKKDDDVDDEMQDFLDQDFDEDLDSYLEDV
jgi:hypothetical protein